MTSAHWACCCKQEPPKNFDIPCAHNHFEPFDPPINCEGICDSLTFHVEGLFLHYPVNGNEQPICVDDDFNQLPMQITLPMSYWQGGGSNECLWTSGGSTDNCMCPTDCGPPSMSRALFARVSQLLEFDDNHDPIGPLWMAYVRVQHSPAGPPGANWSTLVYMHTADGTPGCPPTTGWEWCGYGLGLHKVHITLPGVFTVF